MEFRIKTYYKGELAKKYKVSLKTFNVWIKDIPGLVMLYAVFPADFNGDGKTDLLAWSYNANTPQTAWSVSYSTGTSFVTNPTPITSLRDYGNSTFGNQLSQINLHQVFVADFNGDGKADIVEKTANWNGDPNVANGDLGTDLRTLYGTGSGFIEDNTHFNETYPSAQFANNVHPAISIGDFNGDGHLDLRYRDGNPSQGPVIFTFLENKNIHKVHKIFNGLGAAINVDYNTLPLLAKAGQYTKDNQAAFPVIDFQKALTVVADIKQDNGISGTNETDYAYSGAKMHVQGKGFLGFTKVSSTDVVTGLSSETEYSLPDNTHFFQRTINNIKTFLTSPHVDINEKIYSYNFVPGNNLPLGDPSGLRYYFFVSGISDNDQLHGNIVTLTSVQQDQSGNTISQTTNNPAINVVITNTFELKGAWLPSRLKTTDTITSRGNPNYERSAQFNHDNSGRTVQIINDAGVGTTIGITYDIFGNMLTTTVSGSDIISRSITNTYDAKGRFATSIANALNHTLILTYDDAYGNPASKTDANGLITQYIYDGFGRIKQTVTPTNQQINIVRAWDNSFSNCVYVDQATEIGTPTIKKYYDVLGRILRVQTTGFDGTDIKQDRQYNSIGKLAQESEPYITSSSAFTQYSYDNLLRPLGITSASGATTSYNYTPNTTITDITTTQGSVVKTQRKILDESGLVTSSQDDGGTVTYTYHSNGNPSSISSPLGSTITMQYDNLGRQTKLVDPDAGEMDYEYNSLGELTKQTDAKGNIFNMSYDVLGRILSKTGNDNSAITYLYDVAKKGMIDKITGSTILYNDISCEYTYDNFTRVQSKKEKIDGTDYTTSYAYDVLNHVIQETYPGNGTPFATKMNYNASGYLEKILKASDNSLIWQCNAMSERMQVMQATSGNGLVQTKTYTSLGLLQNALVKNGSTSVWNIDYNFDAPSHNLISRSNVLTGLNETFTYDNVDRLTSVSLNGNPTLNMFYDQSGNINGKSDVGNYNYTGSQPHAVTAIIDPMPNVPTVQQNIVYTTFDKAATITEGNYHAEIFYGPDDARKKMLTKDVPTGNILGTKYYLGNYEKSVNASGDTRELNYISDADGLSAIYVRNIINNIETDSMYYIHTDHLGSIALISSVDQNNNPVVLQEISYDAWGRRRDATTWTIPGTPVHYYFDRGFTGHEHLDLFGLINMNGRMYDPLLGRMLSPDNFVQEAGFSQSFNRFSYCINNPLKYFDPSGYSPQWWNDFKNWWHDNWKPVIITAVAVTLAVVSAGTLSGVSWALVGEAFAAGAGFNMLSNSANIHTWQDAVGYGLAGGFGAVVALANPLSGFAVGGALNVDASYNSGQLNQNSTSDQFWQAFAKGGGSALAGASAANWFQNFQINSLLTKTGVKTMGANDIASFKEELQSSSGVTSFFNDLNNNPGNKILYSGVTSLLKGYSNNDFNFSGAPTNSQVFGVQGLGLTLFPATSTFNTKENMMMTFTNGLFMGVLPYARKDIFGF